MEARGRYDVSRLILRRQYYQNQKNPVKRIPVKAVPMNIPVKSVPYRQAISAKNSSRCTSSDPDWRAENGDMSPVWLTPSKNRLKFHRRGRDIYDIRQNFVNQMEHFLENCVSLQRISQLPIGPLMTPKTCRETGTDKIRFGYGLDRQNQVRCKATN